MRWAAALVAALAAAHPAAARDLTRSSFRVDLQTGQVQAVSQVAEPTGPPWPSPGIDATRSIAVDGRTLSIVETGPGDRAAGKVRWQFTVPGSAAGWIPWQVVQGDTVAYAWREEVPGQRFQYRDVVRALDVTSRRVLWERVDPAHDPPGAAAVGAAHLVVNLASAAIVLETRTGRVVRYLARRAPSFTVTRPGPGRLWVEAGGVLECIDEATAAPRWRVPLDGALRWLLPVPGGDDWLVKTDGRTYRLRAADGRLVWSSPSASGSRPLLSGDRIYEGTVVTDGAHRHARMAVISRDLQTGKAVREYPLGSHDALFDDGSVTPVEARDGWVDVTARFVVLD